MFSVKGTPMDCLVSPLWKQGKSKVNEAINSERSPKFILGILHFIASSDCFLSMFIVHSKTSNIDNLVSGRDVPSHPLHRIYLDYWLHCDNLVFIRKHREWETMRYPACAISHLREVSRFLIWNPKVGYRRLCWKFCRRLLVGMLSSAAHSKQ